MVSIISLLYILCGSINCIRIAYEIHRTKAKVDTLTNTKIAATKTHAKITSFHQSVVSSLDTEVFMTDRQGKITSFSPKIAEIFDYNPIELQGTCIVHLIHRDDRDNVFGKLSKELRTGEANPEVMEIKGRRRNDSIVNLRFHNHLLKDGKTVIGHEITIKECKK